MNFSIKIISVIILLLLQSCLLKNEIDKETYYIPEGFTGKVLVLFNCKDGKPEEWINGRRLYKIPPSGVLKTQFKPNAGSRHEYDNPEKQIKSLREYYEFYYKNAKGKKTPLSLNYAFSKTEENNAVIVFKRDVMFNIGYGNKEYPSSIVYVLKASDSLTLATYYNEKFVTDDKDWCRINHWNTYNALKDTICNKL